MGAIGFPISLYYGFKYGWESSPIILEFMFDFKTEACCGSSRKYSIYPVDPAKG